MQKLNNNHCNECQNPDSDGDEQTNNRRNHFFRGMNPEKYHRMFDNLYHNYLEQSLNEKYSQIESSEELDESSGLIQTNSRKI